MVMNALDTGVLLCYFLVLIVAGIFGGEAGVKPPKILRWQAEISDYLSILDVCLL